MVATPVWNDGQMRAPSLCWGLMAVVATAVVAMAGVGAEIVQIDGHDWARVEGIVRAVEAVASTSGAVVGRQILLLSSALGWAGQQLENEHLPIAPPVQRVAAGQSHTCAVLQSGELVCWGFGGAGRLGRGNEHTVGLDQVPIEAGPAILGDDAWVTDVRCGPASTCAILHDGSIMCFGENMRGHLGYARTGDIAADQSPASVGRVQVDDSRRVLDLSMGSHHMCALLEDHAVKCWGWHWSGRLGYGNAVTIGDDEVPATIGTVSLVPSGETVVQIASGEWHNCALSSSERIVCWGYSSMGQLGYGNSNDVGDDELPSSVGFLPLRGPASSITCGAYHTCAVVNGTEVACWGLGGSGQLGRGVYGNFGSQQSVAELPSVDMGPGTEAASVAAGMSTTCVILASGRLRCWGSNGSNQLGFGKLADSVIGDMESVATAPEVPLGLNRRVAQMAMGNDHSCALLTTGRLLCFGEHRLGRLGIGVREFDSYTPTVVELHSDGILIVPSRSGVAVVDMPRPLALVARGSSHSCVVGENGGVVCFGYGSTGATGYATTDALGDSELPFTFGEVQIAGHGSVVDIELGDTHSCVVFDTGAAHCWGYNGPFGVLGLGHSDNIGDDEVAAAAGPLDLGGRAATLISAGRSHTCALVTSGDFICWGDASFGRLGYGNTQVIGDNELAGAGGTVPISEPCFGLDVVAASSHTCALCSDGRVICWGYAAEGQLGYGDQEHIGDTEPVHGQGVWFGEAEVAVHVAGGVDHNCALMLSGRLFCWGAGGDGRLGYGNTDDIGDDELPGAVGPVPLGGLPTLVQAGCGHQFTCVLAATGQVWCWGKNYYGQLGYGLDNNVVIGDDEPVNATGPVEFGAGAVVTEMAVGGFGVCARLQTGLAMCFGNGLEGANGYGNQGDVGSLQHPAAAGVVPTWRTGYSAPPAPLGIARPVTAVIDPMQPGPIQLPVSLGLAGSSNASALPAAFGSMPPSLALTGVPAAMLKPGLCPPDRLLPAGSTYSCLAQHPPVNGSLADVDTGSLRSLQASSPNTAGLSTLGGGRLVLSGDLGWVSVSSSLARILVNGADCNGIEPLGPSSVACDAPAGVGRRPHVQIRPASAEGLQLPQWVVVPDVEAAWFAAPTILSVAPQQGLWPGGNDTVTFVGTGFGDAITHARFGAWVNETACNGSVASAFIGDVRCEGLVVASDARASCRAPGQSGLGLSARLCVAGQWATAPGVISYQRLVLSTLISECANGGFPAAGGCRVRVLGEGFGHSAAFISQLLVDHEPVNVTWVSSVELSFVLPAGVGPGSVEVVARVDSGQRGELWFERDPPRIGLVQPAALLAGTPDTTVVVTGDNFGTNASAVKVSVGGAACAVVWAAGNRTACRLDRAPIAWTAPRTVQVAVAGSSVVSDAVFVGIPAPSIGTVVAGAVSTAGGDVLRLQGDGLGRGAGDLSAVYVANRSVPVDQVAWVAQQELRLRAPPGTGRDVAVAIVFTSGLQATAAFSYAAPVVTRVTPSYALAGGVVSEPIVLEGRYFPAGNASCDAVATLGGVRCEQVTCLGHQRLLCEGLDATANATWPHPLTTSVVVSGQSFVASDGLLFAGVNAPLLASASPAVADSGEQLVIIGQGFGRKSSDVARVTVGGWSCSDVQHRGDTALACFMPLVTAEMQRQMSATPSDFRDLPVVVVSGTGLRSSSASASVLVSFSGAVRDRLDRAPGAPLGHRPTGQGRSFVLRWRYDAVTNASVLPAETFDLELSTAGGTGNQSQILSVRVADAAQGDGWYQHANFVFTTAPVTFRVRASNPTGPGPWSVRSSLVTESCEAGRFLQSHLLDPALWTCATCPTGAVCSEGAEAPGVGTQTGFWRVPWSAGGLGFHECLYYSACPGSNTTQESSPVTGEALGEGTSRLRARSLATATDSPSNHSSTNGSAGAVGCADGYSGVLCGVCEAGWAQSNGHKCRPCGGIWVMLGVSLGLLTLLVGVIALLVWKSFRNGRRAVASRRPFTAVAKVVISHLQTVAIAASFNLGWPEPLLQMFALMDMTSSISPDVLQLDCAVQRLEPLVPWAAITVEEPRLFFQTSALVLLIPLVLIFLASLYLAIRFCLCRIRGTAMVSPEEAKRAKLRRAARRALHRVPTEEPLERTTSGRGSTQSMLQLARAMSGASSSGKFPSQNQLQLASAPRLEPVREEEEEAPKKARKKQRDSMAAPRLTLCETVSTTASVVLFFCHMSMTKAAFKLLTCIDVSPEVASAAAGDDEAAVEPPPVDPDTQVQLAEALASCSREHVPRRLLADPDVCCYDKESQLYMFGLGFPGVVVYAFGIPVASLLLLWAYRHRLHERVIRMTLGFMYNGFKREAYYWESVVMLRKVGVAAIAILLAPAGPEVQTYSALLLLFGLTVLHTLVRPFRSYALQRLELGSLVTAFFTFECGLFLLSGRNSSTPVALGATMALVAANAFFLGAALWTMLMQVRPPQASAAPASDGPAIEEPREAGRRSRRRLPKGKRLASKGSSSSKASVVPHDSFAWGAGSPSPSPSPPGYGDTFMYPSKTESFVTPSSQPISPQAGSPGRFSSRPPVLAVAPKPVPSSGGKSSGGLGHRSSPRHKSPRHRSPRHQSPRFVPSRAAPEHSPRHGGALADSTRRRGRDIRAELAGTDDEEELEEEVVPYRESDGTAAAADDQATAVAKQPGDLAADPPDRKRSSGRKPSFAWATTGNAGALAGSASGSP